jgi:hypothetical protein
MRLMELINQLARLPMDAEVLGTWEGITEDIEVYAAKDGTVLIDCDRGSYKDEFTSGKRIPRCL